MIYDAADIAIAMLSLDTLLSPLLMFSSLSITLSSPVFAAFFFFRRFLH